MEIWDVLDGNGNKTGRTTERGKKLPVGDYHLIVDVWIRNKKGKYLISRRTPEKKPYSGLWEPTCGCAISGDDSLSTALREVSEELGITLNPENGRFFKRIKLASYFVDVWLFEHEADISDVVLQPGETDCAMWAAKEEILKMSSEGVFIGEKRLPYIGELS